MEVYGTHFPWPAHCHMVTCLENPQPDPKTWYLSVAPLSFRWTCCQDKCSWWAFVTSCCLGPICLQLIICYPCLVSPQCCGCCTQCLQNHNHSCGGNVIPKAVPETCTALVIPIYSVDVMADIDVAASPSPCHIFGHLHFSGGWPPH